MSAESPAESDAIVVRRDLLASYHSLNAERAKYFTAARVNNDSPEAAAYLAAVEGGIDSDAWAAWEHRTICAEASVPLRAAVFLGSTSASAYGYAIGEYFSVQRQHLTPAGLAVIEALERTYGAPAILLTFLDT